MKWYAVTRRYRVEDVCYVKAANAEEAKYLVECGEYEDVTSADTISKTTFPKAARLDGVPRWLWEQMGYPDNEKIAS